MKPAEFVAKWSNVRNIFSLSSTAGVLDAASLARYDPFGNFRTTPTTNPGTTSHGFTGHRHNNTGTYPTQNVGLTYMNARYYLPEVGRFASPDTIVPEPGNPQSYNRYAYSFNNPINYTDSSGHCIDGITTLACVAIGLKILDYGWTAYDTWQAGQTLADPNASSADKMLAGLSVSLSLLFEAIEPDDFLPIGLPVDDIARRGIVSGARQAMQEGGLEAGVRFLTDSLGNQAPSVIRHLYDQGVFREIKSAGEWKHILAGVRGQAGLEVHHLIEQRFAKRLGVAADDLPSIVLDRTFHQQEVCTLVFHS